MLLSLKRPSKRRSNYFFTCYNLIMKIRFFIWLVVCCVVMSSTVFAQNKTFPFTGIMTADKVNIRAGQNKNFEVIGSLQKGHEVVVLDQSYSWYKIKLPDDAQCYVSRKLVQFLRDNIGEINGNRVNVRARAAIDASVIGQLSKATKVKIVDTSEEWYRIEPVEGLYGWVLMDLVEFKSDQIPPPKVVQLPSQNIYLQKRQEEELLRAEEEKKRLEQERQKVIVKGTAIAITEEVPGANVRHQVTGDDGQVFYLMGYRSVLDGFLNHRVYIEGLPQGEPVLAHPVLMVTKIVLIL